MDTTVESLSQATVFKGLADDSLVAVGRCFQPLCFRKGETVVTMGDASDAVFLIAAGGCKVSIPFDFNMGENILSFLDPGELFGEMGVITGNPRAANITCTSDSRLLVMPAAAFWQITEANPVILKNIVSILSARLVAQNEGRQARRRAPLHLCPAQREGLDRFHRSIGIGGRRLLSQRMNTRVPVRRAANALLAPVTRWLHRGLRFLLTVATAPYLKEIRGLEHIPRDRPVIYLLSYRSAFDFLFAYHLVRRTDPGRVLTFALPVNHIGKWRFSMLRGFFSILRFSYLDRDAAHPLGGSEDVVRLIHQPDHRHRIVDVALHPFFKRSMRYDVALSGDHLNVWLNAGDGRAIVPVVIRGTDKFWPFEPWPRRFPSVSAFFKLRSVSITVGEAIDLCATDLKARIERCQGDAAAIAALMEHTNRMIGTRMAALEGQGYLPVGGAGEAAMLRMFNEQWLSRLSLMLPAGLGLRRKYHRASVKIRHFMWHAEMLNVLLTHLDGEGWLLPPWARGMLVAGASYADVRWPFFSFDHSYNPYTGKGLKFVFRFPDLMGLIRSDTEALMRAVDRGAGIERILTAVGRIYHYMSDLAIPAHVHNIPHLFVDLPLIGKCDFEEYLGQDQPLTVLGDHDIGDISAVSVTSFEQFYAALDHIARYTFLSASFTEEQMTAIARTRMITEYEGTADLIEKLDLVGVSVHPVEGYAAEKRYYVRNLTSAECADIARNTILFSLKAIAACFIFLVGAVSERMETAHDIQ